jgi:beta-hydroxyacyl-ACP dehydratase FabZ
VAKIDGERQDDLSDESLQKVLTLLGGTAKKDITAQTEAVKKKIDEELTLYFPAIFDDARSKEYYDLLKQRTRAILDCIIEGDTEEREKAVEELTDRMITWSKPKTFSGSGSLEIEYDKQFEDMCLVISQQTHMDAKKIGYIQHKPLMWENECTRHKLLDIIGDMALIGKPIKGRIVATRPGHTINNKFARLMRKEIRKHEIQAPIYDPNEAPVMDNNRIRELLPHRYPMQLVDKIISIGPTSIVGVKNITSNEPFFVGHFPQEPVMPGVLQIEAMAQCGGLLVLNQVEDPERWSTYFMRIDDVKFRQKVVPGDTLLFRVELLYPVRHGVSTMKGYMFVGDHVVSEATFTAQIVKNK